MSLGKKLFSLAKIPLGDLIVGIALIVPKKQIKNLTTIKEEDFTYIIEVYRVAKEIITELGWEAEGHAILVNGGEWQEVNQLHFHLHRGKQLRE